jgi:uncharacterized protein
VVAAMAALSAGPPFFPHLAAVSYVSLPPWRGFATLSSLALEWLLRGELTNMPGLLQRLLPREEGFFDLFVKQAENIVVGAKRLQEMLAHYTGVPEQVQTIKAIEHQGDEITHDILTKLNQTFITPFDREDIHALSSQLDDVIDLIDAAASRFVLYRVNEIRAGTVDLVKVLVSATGEVSAAVRALGTPDEALRHCIEINRYENESDRICRTLIAQLFDEEKDSVQIIKWKEIFEVIETAVDKCEDVANVIEGVIVKSA